MVNFLEVPTLITECQKAVYPLFFIIFINDLPVHSFNSRICIHELSWRRRKQNKGGYRKKQYGYKKTIQSHFFQVKTQNVGRTPHELGGETQRYRTRAQTALKTNEICSNAAKEASTDFNAGNEVEFNASARPENRDSTVRQSVYGSNETYDSQTVLNVLAESGRDPNMTSGPGSDASSSELEEEREEFFMALEETTSTDSGATPKNNRKKGKLDLFSSSKRETEDASNKSYQGENIASTLTAMNSKLLKLDTLENLNLKLEGNISSVQTKVEDVSNSINTVKVDLSKYERRWEETSKGLAGRISELEKGAQSWEKRWELQRETVSRDCKILQASIESNSKRVIELELLSENATQRWKSLDSLEDKIKTAAENKFQAIQEAITDDLRKELLEEIKAAKSPQVTLEDLEKVKEEFKATVQAQTANVLHKSQFPHTDSSVDNQYSRLKGQAFSNRHNILVFGLMDNNSTADDQKEVCAFFEKRMGLPNLKIKVTFRLGTYRTDAIHPRPLVVKFGDIRDRWRVWNNKSKIKFEKDHPILIQEDLPKKLREDHRILQRIAKVAWQNPESYREVKVKDYKIHINGIQYGMG